MSGVALLIVVSFEVRADRGCGEQPADVLDHDPLGLQCVDGFRHVCPEPGAGAGLEAGHLAHGRYVLAREPAAEDVDRRYGVPVDGGDVAEVGCVGPVLGEDAGDGIVDLGEPDRLCSEDFFGGEVESAVAGEQRPDTQRYGLVGLGLVCHGRTSWNGDPRSRSAAPSWSPTRCTNHPTLRQTAATAQVTHAAVDGQRFSPLVVRSNGLSRVLQARRATVRK